MFLNDQETEVDLLYYEAIAKTVVRLVRTTSEAPVTIGVHGDWGAGKSSVLKMTEAAFAKDSRVLCLWFNGWAFEGFEDAKAVVIETIVEELRAARPASAKVTEAARKVLKRVDWLKLAKKAGGYAFTAMSGIPTFDQVNDLLTAARAFLAKPRESISSEDVTFIAQHAGEYVKGEKDEADHLPAQICQFREEFRALIEAAEIDQLVVLVDDLDRCLPQTAIATLEAIRLFLFVPRTAFVIGADELMIEYAVAEHFPALPPTSGPLPYARNYLEKLIQVPFRIPGLGLAETRMYVALLLAENALGAKDPRFRKLLDVAREDLRRPWRSRGLDRLSVEAAIGKDIPPAVDQALVISGQVTRILAEGTRGNPRQIKRFLNSLMLRHAIAEERGFAPDIERPVLAKIMLAERFSPDYYEHVARLAASAPNGKPEALASFEDLVKAPEEEEPAARKGEKTAGRRKPALPAEAEEWAKSEWAKRWAAIEPPLKDVDLRPYVFVTRDKRSYLSGLAMDSHLEGLVDRLMGPRLTARAAATEVRKLAGTEPEEVFEAIRTRILQSDAFAVEPKGVQGLVVLVGEHPGLERRLLGFVRELPTPKLGPWAATSVAQCFRDPTVAREFSDLLHVWAGQVENKTLSVATQNLLQMSAKKV